MTLSIITINLNNIEGLRRTLESVLSQSFTDYEWIVIDGGSTDGSKELIESHTDHFTYWVSKPDKGIYNAMNKAITHAHGDWILFLNSGDWLHQSDTLDAVFKTRWNTDVVYGDVVYHWPDGRDDELEIKPDTFGLYYFYEHTLCHQATFYRRGIFDSHRYNEDYKICADWALFIRLVIEGYTFSHIHLCISHFVQDGISAKLTENHLLERKRVLHECIPPAILHDMEELYNQEQESKRLNSHKLYRFIISQAKRRISLAEKIFHKIENKQY